MPFEGPYPVWLAVRNDGPDTIRIVALESDDHFNPTFEEPAGWEIRKRFMNSVDGILAPPPICTLANGAETRRVVYLHDLFSDMTEGTSELQVSLRVWIKNGDDVNGVRLKTTVTVQLVRQGQDALARRIREVATRIWGADGQSRDEKPLASILSLSHPDLVPFYRDLLRAGFLYRFRDRVVKGFVELAEKYGTRQMVVDYLRTSGVQGDQLIFEHWRQKGIAPTHEQTEQLLDANNPWVKLTAVEYLTEPGKYPGFTASIEQEIRNLIGRAKSIGLNPMAERNTSPMHETCEPRRTLSEQKEEQSRPWPTWAIFTAGGCGLVLGLIVGLLAGKPSRHCGQERN